MNQIRPGTIPWDPSFVFTGRTDEYLAELGCLDLRTGEAIMRERLAAAPLR